MIIDRPSARDVLDRLVRKGVVPPGGEVAARAALTTLDASQMPWYLRVVIAVGAWAGAGFFLSFVLGIVALALGRRFNDVAIVLGVMFMAAAILLRRRMSAATLGAQFGKQIALVGSFTGQILFIGGVAAEFDAVLAATVAALAASALMIATFPDRVQRFGSTLLAVSALVVVLYEWKVPYGADGLALTLAALPLLLWRAAPRGWADAASEIIEPAVYAAVVSLFGLLLAHTFFHVIVGIGSNAWFQLSQATTIGLVAALLWLACAVLSEHGVNMGSAEVAAACGAIVLLGYVTRTTPAIVATVLVLLLGFDRHARALVALAALFFIVFASHYYYSLELTLLQKSGVLAASGVVSLAAAAFVRWRFALEEPA